MLQKSKIFEGRTGPLVFIVMDGVGIGKEDDSNAIYLAKTPVLDKLNESSLRTVLKAHGTAVGLPTDDDMGNSEVGHNAIGAGRVFDQGAKLVESSLESGKIFESNIWKSISERGQHGKTIHFAGLLSDGNVHSHIDHLIHMVKKVHAENVKSVRIHTLLDGRDVDGKSALKYLAQIEDLCCEISSIRGFDYRIASGGGRMNVTMDRYNADWNIVKKGWDAHVNGIGRKFHSASEAIQTYYDEDPKMTDQYLDSFVITHGNGEPVGRINNGDAVVFFNFRGDRAIEITLAFESSDFKEFDKGRVPDNVLYAGMLEYDGDLKIPKNYLVAPPHIDKTLCEFLCKEKMTSFAISETQKFGHVTYFWNGNKSGYVDETLETYIEIPSDIIPFDQAPKMKAYEITEKTIEMLNSGKYKFGRLNFANGDMVGHTGDMESSIVAIETVDQCVGEILDAVEKLNGLVVITADHGNSDEMFTMKNGVKNIKTSHSLNAVPLYIFDPQFKNEYSIADIDSPGLTNIAGTLLNLLGYENLNFYDDSLITF